MIDYRAVDLGDIRGEQVGDLRFQTWQLGAFLRYKSNEDASVLIESLGQRCVEDDRREAHRAPLVEDRQSSAVMPRRGASVNIQDDEIDLSLLQQRQRIVEVGRPNYVKGAEV